MKFQEIMEEKDRVVYLYRYKGGRVKEEEGRENNEGIVGKVKGLRKRSLIILGKGIISIYKPNYSID